MLLSEAIVMLASFQINCRLMNAMKKMLCSYSFRHIFVKAKAKVKAKSMFDVFIKVGH